MSDVTQGLKKKNNSNNDYFKKCLLEYNCFEVLCYIAFIINTTLSVLSILFFSFYHYIIRIKIAH